MSNHVLSLPTQSMPRAAVPLGLSQLALTSILAQFRDVLGRYSGIPLSEMEDDRAPRCLRDHPVHMAAVVAGDGGYAGDPTSRRPGGRSAVAVAENEDRRAGLGESDRVAHVLHRLFERMAFAGDLDASRDVGRFVGRLEAGLLPIEQRGREDIKAV